MRRLTTISGSVLWTLAAAWLVGPAVPAGGQSISQQELTEQAQRLEKLGKLWLKAGVLDETQEEYRDEIRAIKAITIDEQSLTGLQAVVNTPRQDPIDLFVADRLLRPLAWSKTEVIRKALPMVKAFLKRVGKFQDLPFYSEEALEKYRYPEGATETQKAFIDEQRKAKIEKETPIKLHNEQVADLQKLLFELMVIANDSHEDTELFGLLKSAESKGWWAYSQIADTFRSESKRMSIERAKALYEQFERLWNELREDMEHKKLTQKEYVDQANIVLRPADNSTFTYVKDNPCPRLLRTINHLAPMARMPALKDPSGKQPPQPGGKQPPTPGGGAKRPPPAGAGGTTPPGRATKGGGNP